MLNKDKIINEINERTRVVKNAYKSTQEFAKTLRKDPDKDLRIKDNMCIYCFYQKKEGIFAGQAFCERSCGICDVKMDFSSTYTDFLCAECAKDNDCCKHCGSNIDYKIIK